LLIASNTACGMFEVTGGLRVPFAAVALGSFSVAVEALVEPVVFGVLADDVFVLGFALSGFVCFADGFFAVVFFAVGFFVPVVFVVFAMFFFSSLLFFQQSN
jgi:hypothetical protein